jgi:hypothetical protein
MITEPYLAPKGPFTLHFHRSQEFRERQGWSDEVLSRNEILGKPVGRIPASNLPFAGLKTRIVAQARNRQNRPEHVIRRQKETATEAAVPVNTVVVVKLLSFFALSR